MTKTKIVNDTDSDVDLREGQAGIFRKIATLDKKGGKFMVPSNVHATYKEYLCASVVNGKSQLILSSDDLNEWREIKIVESVGNTKFKWEGVNPRQKTAESIDASGGCSIL